MGKKWKDDRSWWQKLSASGKASFIVLAVVVCVLLAVAYFAKVSNYSADAFHLLLVVSVLENAVLVIITSICNVETSSKIESSTADMLLTFKKIYAEFKADKKLLDGDIPDFDDMKTDSTSQELQTLPADQLAKIKADIESHDYSGDNQRLVDRRYERQQRKHEVGANKADEPQNQDSQSEDQPKKMGDIVHYEFKQFHTGDTGEINPDAVDQALATEQPPSTGTQTPNIQNKQPDSPGQLPSIEEQLEELGLGPNASKFLVPLLNEAGCKHWTNMSPDKKATLQDFMNMMQEAMPGPQKIKLVDLENEKYGAQGAKNVV